ncbi:MAG: hypothetical protein PVI43_01260 [Candidatus Bathyarchaeota archaeon]|jgi:hypothetical protein
MADPRGDILKYTGVNYAFAPTYIRDRAPTTQDTADEQGLYKVPSIWIHTKSTTAPVDADVWILVNLQANNANGATWLLFTGGTGGSVTELRADDGNIAMPASGIIDVDGNIVANGTNAFPLFTRANVANTLDIDLQLATTVTPTPGDSNDAGLSSFNENHFIIDATSGMVSGVGDPSKGFIQTLTGDTGGAVGPDGNGNIDFTGDQTQQFVQVNGIPGSNLQEIKIIEPAQDGELLIGNTVASAPKVGELTSNDGSVNINYNDPDIDLSVGATPVEGFTNLGFNYSSPTFSITSRDGSALSASNPATVTFNSKANPGQLVTVSVTANQSFDDSSGTSTIVDNRLGLLSGDNWGSNDIPIFVYAVLNDDEDDVTFMISRVPSAYESPPSGRIGTPAAAQTSQQMFFAFSSITTTSWDNNPIVYIGCFRMRYTQPGGADDWTVQALDERDGPARTYDSMNFVFPQNVFGAASSTRWQPEGGTAPVYDTEDCRYIIKRDGTCVFMYSGSTNTTPGAGAVDAKLAIPFNGQEGLDPWNFIGSGVQQVSSSDADILNWQPNSTGNDAEIWYTNHADSGVLQNADITADIRMSANYQILTDPLRA